MTNQLPKVINLLRLQRYPILKQLYLEEALLRADDRSWLLVNDGTYQAVVLGVSGKPSQLVYTELAAAANIPLIRRFTGGGTVVVDHNTIFTSLIMSEGEVPGLQAYPRPIMKWTEDLFKHAFDKYEKNFLLQEHDYAFGQRKFGGNAQAISKGRWVHHTSFLYDYDKTMMSLLRQPDRAPKYRNGRSHEEFIIPLKNVIACRSTLIESVCEAIENKGFRLVEGTLEEAEDVISKNTLTGTRLLDY